MLRVDYKGLFSSYRKPLHRVRHEVRCGIDIEYDAAKDAANIAKHGLSLSDATMIDLLTAAVSIDDRGYAERRFRAYQRIDGVGYCLAFTVRGTVVRPISFRRAHDKEMKRHGR